MDGGSLQGELLRIQRLSMDFFGLLAIAVRPVPSDMAHQGEIRFTNQTQGVENMSHDLYETEVRPLIARIEETHSGKSFAYRQGMFWRQLSDDAKRLMADNVYINMTRSRRGTEPKAEPVSSDAIRAAYIATFWQMRLPDGTAMVDATAGKLRRFGKTYVDLTKGLKDNEKLYGKVTAEDAWNVWQRHAK